MIFYLLAFVALLGPLVFVHELGHFLFAKLFNVRVDTFSMGFGPKIFKRQWGETEYCLSIVPLGGYVKLYGQDPSEAIEPGLKHRALNNLGAWKRFLVFVGGPLFNFLFAIVVFSTMLMMGEESLAPNVGRVVPGTQAHIAGFRSGDVITAVDRNIVTKFPEVAQLISDSASKELVFRVKRGGAKKEIKVTPQNAPGFSIYGEPIEVGEIDGLYAAGRYTTVGVSNPQSAAAQAGFKTGDEIVTLNGMSVKSWEALEEMVQKDVAAGKAKLKFGIVPRATNYWNTDSKPQPASSAIREIELAAKPLDQLGLASSELFIASLISPTPINQEATSQIIAHFTFFKTTLSIFLSLISTRKIAPSIVSLEKNWSKTKLPKE